MRGGDDGQQIDDTSWRLAQSGKVATSTGQQVVASSLDQSKYFLPAHSKWTTDFARYLARLLLSWSPRSCEARAHNAQLEFLVAASSATVENSFLRLGAPFGLAWEACCFRRPSPHSRGMCLIGRKALRGAFRWRPILDTVQWARAAKLAQK